MNNELLTHFKNISKSKKRTKSDSDAFYKRIMDRQGKKRQKIAEAKKRYKQEEFLECTYKPKINRKKGKKRKMKGICNRVDEILQCREKKKMKIRKMREMEKEHEMNMCTFRPKINKRKNNM